MSCSPPSQAPLVLLVTATLACSTAVGALTCALWLVCEQQLRLAVAVISFALLVAPAELVGGSLLAVQLSRRAPFGGTLACLAVWVAGSAGVVTLSATMGPEPRAVILLGLAVVVVGGLLCAWVQRTPWVLVRAALPWAVGAVPLWWASGCAAPRTPEEAATQGLAVMGSVILPVLVASVLLRRSQVGRGGLEGRPRCSCPSI